MSHIIVKIYLIGGEHNTIVCLSLGSGRDSAGERKIGSLGTVIGDEDGYLLPSLSRIGGWRFPFYWWGEFERKMERWGIYVGMCMMPILWRDFD